MDLHPDLYEAVLARLRGAGMMPRSDRLADLCDALRPRLKAGEILTAEDSAGDALLRPATSCNGPQRSTTCTECAALAMTAWWRRPDARQFATCTWTVETPHAPDAMPPHAPGAGLLRGVGDHATPVTHEPNSGCEGSRTTMSQARATALFVPLAAPGGHMALAGCVSHVGASTPHSAHPNTKYCAPCAQGLRHRPRANVTATQAAMIHQLRGTMSAGNWPSTWASRRPSSIATCGAGPGLQCPRLSADVVTTVCLTYQALGRVRRRRSFPTSRALHCRALQAVCPAPDPLDG